MKKIFYILLSSGLLITACGESNTSEDTGNEMKDKAEQHGQMKTETEESVVDGSLTRNGLTVAELTDFPKFPEAKLQLKQPQPNSKVDAGEVKFSFDVQNYKLGVQTSDADQKDLAVSAKGQHIHLILNNGPYSAHYEPEFTKELKEGHYVVLAFPARSYHLSVKEPAARVLTKITVGNPADTEMADLENDPHLFYSRPKGTYVGQEQTQKILLDFYLVNTNLSQNGNKVRATINGTRFLLAKWAPYTIEGLSSGQNTIKLELINNEGEVIPGPFNTVERTITLKPEESPTAS